MRKPIVEHFREDVLHAHCSDGFVVGGGLSACRTQNALAASFNKPFWLQLVGTGLTTAFAVQLGSTLSHAQLPCITCSELWEHDLLKEGLEIVDGYAAVPDAPGLGVEVDEGVIDRYRVDPGAPIPTNQYRARKRILRISWPGAAGGRRTLDFTHESNYQQEFYKGSIPGFRARRRPRGHRGRRQPRLCRGAREAGRPGALTELPLPPPRSVRRHGRKAPLRGPAGNLFSRHDNFGPGALPTGPEGRGPAPVAGNRRKQEATSSRSPRHPAGYRSS